MRPHEHLAWNRPLDVHTGLADLRIPDHRAGGLRVVPEAFWEEANSCFPHRSTGSKVLGPGPEPGVSVKTGVLSAVLRGIDGPPKLPYG